MARTHGLTSIPTPTHIWPSTPNLVRVDLPEPEGAEYKRVLLVPTEINETLKKLTGFSKIRGVLQRYISGSYITASMKGDPRRRHPDLERLLNVNEVWVMCIRQPKIEQWRLMGRFADFNAFVGLALFRRQFLDGEKTYTAQAEKFAAGWPIGIIPVHSGGNVEAYMS